MRNKHRLKKLEKIMGVKEEKHFVILSEDLAEDDQVVICFDSNKKRTTMTKEEFDQIPDEEKGDVLEMGIEYV